jgi:hypothetical protein
MKFPLYFSIKVGFQHDNYHMAFMQKNQTHKIVVVDSSVYTTPLDFPFDCLNWTTWIFSSTNLFFGTFQSEFHPTTSFWLLMLTTDLTLS